MTKEELKNKKDEMKNKISMELKSSITQQGFEIFCKNLAKLEKENAELKKQLSDIVECFQSSSSGDDFEMAESAREIMEILDISCYRHGKVKSKLTEAKELIDKLSKSLFLAKGIVRDLIDDTVDFKESKERAEYCYKQEKFDTYREAEQFIKE